MKGPINWNGKMVKTVDSDFGLPINPSELKIEITKACNLLCSFCSPGDPEQWRSKRHMPEREVLRWIDWAVSYQIPAVRFTGGEAVLHPHIRLFCSYAYLRNRWVILNTNAMADGSLYDELIVDDLRVSVPCLEAARLDEITGCTGVLEKKLALIERTLSKGRRRVCMLTVLTPELIGKMEEFVKLLQAMPGLIWFPLRYESSPSNPRPLTRSHIQAMAEEMAGLMDRYPKHAKGIYQAAPFCSVTPISLGARVFQGRAVNCGPHTALNVTINGQLTACFDICELFTEGTMEDVKRSPKLHECCSLNALPLECRECRHVQRCAGGCRKPPGLVEHNGRFIDYLAGFVVE